MTRTYTFKGSTDSWGYSAWIEDGQLVICESWPREGGIIFRGGYKDATPYLNEMLRRDPGSKKLHDAITKYYSDDEEAKRVAAKAAEVGVTYRFKDSRDSHGNGYSGWISNTGLLILEHDDPRGGGVIFEGRYEDMPPALANRLVELRAQDPVLYDDIEKYFTKHGVTDESDRKDLGGAEAKTITYKVRLIMDNGKEIVAIISGTSETEVIRKIMLPVPDTVMMYDLEGRTMAVRSDKIYTVAILG